MATDDYEVYALEYGRTMDQPVGVALYGAYNEGVAPMPYGFVAARNKSRVVLVDIGFEAKGSGERMRTKFRVEPYISPVRALNSIGIKAGDVTHVIVTHAHYDHMGSLGSFPSAQFYLQKEELEKWKWALGKGKAFANVTAACNPDDVVERVNVFAKKLWIGATVLYIALGVFTYVAGFWARGFVNPGIVPIAAVAVLLVAGYFINRKMEGWAFIMVALNIVLTQVTFFSMTFPNVMLSTTNPDWSLTIYNASSSQYTLTVMSIVALIFVPIVLAYQGWTYYMFRKRISTDKKTLVY